MNTLELNAEAEGILTYIRSKTEDPREGLAILGMALCMIYDRYADPAQLTFEKFVDEFHMSLLETQKDKTNIGPRTVQ